MNPPKKLTTSTQVNFPFILLRNGPILESSMINFSIPASAGHRTSNVYKIRTIEIHATLLEINNERPGVIFNFNSLVFQIAVSVQYVNYNYK